MTILIEFKRHLSRTPHDHKFQNEKENRIERCLKCVFVLGLRVCVCAVCCVQSDWNGKTCKTIKMGCVLCAASIDHHFSICLFVFFTPMFIAHSVHLIPIIISFPLSLNLYLYTRFDYVSFEITILSPQRGRGEEKRNVVTTTTSGKTWENR